MPSLLMSCPADLIIGGGRRFCDCSLTALSVEYSYVTRFWSSSTKRSSAYNLFLYVTTGFSGDSATLGQNAATDDIVRHELIALTS